MGVRERARIETGADQTREVSHVDEQVGTDFIGNGTKLGEVDAAGIGRAARNNELGLVLVSELAHLVEINEVGLRVDTIVHGLEPFPRLVDGRAMGEVAACGERQTENGVARLEQRVEHALVGLANQSSAERWRSRN